jgi:sarcosine oxidase delta subunit
MNYPHMTNTSIIDSNNNFFMDLMTTLSCEQAENSPINTEDYCVNGVKQTHDEDQTKCLITDDPLVHNHVTLHCNHSFNYEPLFHSLKMNKKYYKSFDPHVRSGKIKCPYCRKFTKGLLPYIQSYEIVHGLNYPPSAVMKHRCKYIMTRGKNKGIQCSSYTHDDACGKHSKLYETQQKKNNPTNDTPQQEVIQTHPTCSFIISSGKRKGKVCGKKCKEGLSACGFHKNKL